MNHQKLLFTSIVSLSTHATTALHLITKPCFRKACNFEMGRLEDK